MGDHPINSSWEQFLQELGKATTSSLESLSLENESLRIDDERMKVLKLVEKVTDIDLKRMYGNNILNILIYWMVFVGFILFIHLGPLNNPFSNEVIIVLLTTTTANIIALPIIILKYLFPHNK